MKAKARADKRFDAILRRMLIAKPLSKAKISARIRARRKAAKAGR